MEPWPLQSNSQTEFQAGMVIPVQCIDWQASFASPIGDAGRNYKAMFALAFDRAHRVLHLQLSGVYNSDDMDRFDLVALGFVEANGPVHMILDFSGTTALAVPTTKLSQRGQLPPLCPSCKRVMVTPRPELKEFARTFGEHQRQIGYPAPLVVETLREALCALSIGDQMQFEPVPHSFGM